MSKIEESKYNLEERTAKLGESVIEFCNNIPRDSITNPLVNQLVRAGTSVGANYCEANNAQSKKEFIHKIGICKKEARETQYWIRMIVRVVSKLREKALVLWKEAQELVLIFASIISSSRRKKEI
ncbi:four helix bundle protein [Candidatus Berkelbacteria bacterium]|nr:four helix bundle protein [Candidatus Berkelbacteria bacterium]MBI4029736.1 four helix bundle protein [Candidatus Berkelbacteria bacterium]